MNRVLKSRNKCLVLGLGGTGKRAILELKKRLRWAGYQESDWRHSLKMLCLDFDPVTLTGQVRTATGSEGVFLGEDELCELDATEIQHRLHHLKEEYNLKYFQRWYPDLEGAFIRLGSFRAGAAQWRALGRLGLFEHAERVHVTLQRAAKQLLSKESLTREGINGGQLVVYLISSLSGGTGAGMLLDVAYFARNLAPNQRQIALLLLPGIYAEHDIGGRLYANTYSTLKELTAFANQTQPFEADYPSGRRIRVAVGGRPPLDFVFLYDNMVGDNRLTNNVETVAAIMAESIFLDVEQSQLSQAKESSLTNMLSHSGGMDTGPLVSSCVFASRGALTLSLPPLKSVRRFLGDKYLHDFFLPALRQRSTADRPGEAAQANQDPKLKARFGELGDYLNHLERDTAEKCRGSWGEPFLILQGSELGKHLIKYKDHKEAEGQVRTWLEHFFQPAVDGVCKTVPPHELPDCAKDETGHIYQSGLALIEKLKEGLTSLEGEETDDLARKLALKNYEEFLSTRAAKLRQEAKDLAEQLKGDLESLGESSLQRYLDDMAELWQAHPSGLLGLDEAAAVHWGQRFLRRLKAAYDKAGRHIRVKTTLAGTMETFRETHLQGKESQADQTQAILQEHLARLTEAINQRLKELALELQGQESEVYRSLANAKFQDQVWGALAGQFKAEAEADEFHRFLAEFEDLTKVTYADFNDKATKMSEDRVGEALKRQPSALNLMLHLDPSTLKRELGRARHDYMFDNTVVNPNARHIIYALAPRYDGGQDNPAWERIRESFQGLLSNELKASTLNLDSYDLLLGTPAEDEPGRLLISHVVLNNPPQNLREIHEYYYAYARHHKAKHLFHIDRDFAKFPEIVLPSQMDKAVHCGNPDCDQDLGDVPRDTILCPSCHRPIRSRCGNPDCLEDELHKKEEMKGEHPHVHCPTCGQLARTYWWWCPEHNVYNSTSVDFCLKCLAEYDNGRRPFERVERREGVKHRINCPGCEQDPKYKDKPFQVEFLDIYYDVPDHLIGRAMEVYYKETNHGRCPNCDALLLPLCPYSDPKDNKPHFVQRAGHSATDFLKMDTGSGGASNYLLGEGLFFCTTDQEHAKRCIRECSFCGLPLKDDALYCPRCKRTATRAGTESKPLDYRPKIIDFGPPPLIRQRRRCEDQISPAPPVPAAGPHLSAGAPEEACPPETTSPPTRAALEKLCQERGVPPEHTADFLKGWEGQEDEEKSDAPA